MEFWIFLCLAILLILCFPYVRFLIKRLLLARRLKRLCEKNSLRLYPPSPHRFWMLGKRRGSACDFYIETPDLLYAVKLFGAPNRYSVLVLTEDGQYFFRNFVFMIASYTMVAQMLNGKKRRLQAIDFRKHFPAQEKDRPVKNVLLIHPAFREIHYQPERGREKILGEGDAVFDFELKSASGFMKEIREVSLQKHPRGQ